MKMRREKPTGHIIKRRTFEGEIDPSKNDNSLTSKYMPSYRYWLKITYPHNIEGITSIYRRKKDAEDAFELAIKLTGTLY